MLCLKDSESQAVRCMTEISAHREHRYPQRRAPRPRWLVAEERLAVSGREEMLYFSFVVNTNLTACKLYL